MAPATETEEQPLPDVSCYCKGCEDFRIPHDSLWELFEKPRDTDGVENGVADLLWSAWQSTQAAWGKHQQHHLHEIVQKPRHHGRNGTSSAKERAQRPADNDADNEDDSDPIHWINGRYYGKFIVCDHCHAHALKCNEASVCDQCELHGQPCIHRECRLSSDKENCGNPECRYVHRKDQPPKGRNDPSWVILPGKLTSYGASGFRPSKPLDALTAAHSQERIRLLQPIQSSAVNALNAAAASGMPLQRHRHDCDCPPADDTESDEETWYQGTSEPDASTLYDDEEPQCSVCLTNVSTSSLWAITPCSTRTCFECALRSCIINTGPRCKCRADACPFLVLSGSEDWWDDVPEKYPTSRRHNIFSQTKWLRNHTIRELDTLRRELLQ